MDESKEVVPADAPAWLPQKRDGWRGRLIPSADTPLVECPTSLDLTTRRGKALAIAAGNPATLEMPPGGMVRILATDYLCYPDEVVNPQTGEVSAVTRIVLLDKDGNTVRSTSEYVAHRLAAALSLFTADEWLAGIPCVIRCRPSKRHPGGSYHELSVDTE